MMGRPTVYTPEIAQEICEKLAEGQTLREVCRSDHLPDERTVRRWALDNVNGFSPQYAEAREIGYHVMADELLDIADNGTNDWMERNGEDDAGWQANGEHLQRSRLRVDTRKWMLSKTLPKIYGDRVTQEHVGANDGPIQFEEKPSDKMRGRLDAIASRTTGSTAGS